MKQLKSTILIVLCIIISPVNADISLKFGVYASDKPTTMVRTFRPVLNALEHALTEKLGESTKISLQVAKSYDQGIEDIVSGKVDFSRMGPASYVVSQNSNPDLRLLAMESSNGSKIFYGVICVRQQSEIVRIEQLKGRSFAFGNERSTIGRYLAQYKLMKRGVFASDLADYKYLGRHDRVGSAVGAGQFDAGALKESTFRKLQAKGVEIRELSRFPNVTKPWIASSTLSNELVDALRHTLQLLDDPAALAAIKKDGFLPAKDSDYDLIRESMRKNGEFSMARNNN